MRARALIEAEARMGSAGRGAACTFLVAGQATAHADVLWKQRGVAFSDAIGSWSLRPTWCRIRENSATDPVSS